MTKKIALTALLLAVVAASVVALSCVWMDYAIEGLE